MTSLSGSVLFGDIAHLHLTFDYLKMSCIYCIYFLTSHLLSCIFMYQTKKSYYIKKRHEISYMK